MEETIGTKFLLTIVKNHCCTDFMEDNGVKIVNIWSKHLTVWHVYEQYASNIINKLNLGLGIYYPRLW